eukprot:1161760-Pelagomonas_calceolata.AAC.4
MYHPPPELCAWPNAESPDGSCMGFALVMDRQASVAALLLQQESNVRRHIAPAVDQQRAQGTCVKAVWNLHGFCTGHGRNLHRSCTGHGQAIVWGGTAAAVDQQRAQVMCEICREHRACTRHGQANVLGGSRLAAVGK